MTAIGLMGKALTFCRRWWYWLSIFVAGVGLGIGLIGPVDAPIPTKPPEESNRVQHPRGFSIVLPPNRKLSLFDNNHSQGISSGPRRGRAPSRLNFGLSVVRLGPEEPDRDSGFQTMEFQGGPAREKQAIEETNYKWGPHLVYRLAFRREGCWYEIQYDHPGQIKSLPEMVRRYLLTFRVEGSMPR